MYLNRPYFFEMDTVLIPIFHLFIKIEKIDRSNHACFDSIGSH